MKNASFLQCMHHPARVGFHAVDKDLFKRNNRHLLQDPFGNKTGGFVYF
ncbi:hypothetical protein SDC9_172822 [bioreactor metagenome]|uniref:Uncharacterized protein n=1 Tax=bioreactor metagenome TaxID=1076179 RepID=A0A645GNZ2_9ZZZZ